MSIRSKPYGGRIPAQVASASFRHISTQIGDMLTCLWQRIEMCNCGEMISQCILTKEIVSHEKEHFHPQENFTKAYNISENELLPKGSTKKIMVIEYRLQRSTYAKDHFKLKHAYD